MRYLFATDSGRIASRAEATVRTPERPLQVYLCRHHAKHSLQEDGESEARRARVEVSADRRLLALTAPTRNGSPDLRRMCADYRKEHLQMAAALEAFGPELRRREAGHVLEILRLGVGFHRLVIPVDRYAPMDGEAGIGEPRLQVSRQAPAPSRCPARVARAPELSRSSRVRLGRERRQQAPLAEDPQRAGPALCQVSSRVSGSVATMARWVSPFDSIASPRLTVTSASTSVACPKGELRRMAHR